MYVYMLVTTDKYELPLAIADTAAEPARIIGVNPDTIYSSINKEKRKKFKRRCRYKKVAIDDD